MNVQQTELPREAAAFALEVEKAVQAVHATDHKVQPAQREPGEEDREQAGSRFTREDAEKLFKQAEKYFGDKGVNLRFKVLEGEGTDVQVEMVDASTKKVIRKIPGDEVVKLSENIKRMAKGVMDKAV
jgi:uncharacterized FlaG/YvyC family protein